MHLTYSHADVLTKNLVTAAIAWDKEDNFNKRPCDRTNMHLSHLLKLSTAVECVSMCGRKRMPMEEEVAYMSSQASWVQMSYITHLL